MTNDELQSIRYEQNGWMKRAPILEQINPPKHRQTIAKLLAHIDQLSADADLGRLVRQLPKYWCVGLYDGGWWVIDESVGCDAGARNVEVADTPEVALRMAMEGTDEPAA